MITKQEECTIGKILRGAIYTLRNSNIECPHIDAEILLAHVLSCDRLVLHTKPDTILSDEDISKYKAFINKRAGHMPLQYITGHVEFMSLDFVVDKRVLIPRPETEVLVETVLDVIKNKPFSSNKTVTILDIGTGSGNIAISLAKYIHNAQIYACDISKEALEVAKINVHKHSVAERSRLMHGDLFGPLGHYIEKGALDFIVSNPPYVNESEYYNLESGVKDHEPRIALDSGKDGLAFYKRIINECPYWLRPKGHLVLEAGETQAKSIVEIMENEGYFEDIEIVKDLQKIERIIRGQVSC